MALPTRNILSLCAGVGGLELGILLALDSLGQSGRGIVYVEREIAAAASLVASMESGWLHPAPIWSDMLTFDGKPWRRLVHILASGDPCQDNSVAGQRAGSSGKRFLVPEVCRIAAECRPDIIFRENVPGNADGQLAAIIPALEELGYRIAAGIFSSAETGNTMRRERLFIMAESDGRSSSDGQEQRGRQFGLHTKGNGTGRKDAQLGGPIGHIEARRQSATGETSSGRTHGQSGRSGGALGSANSPELQGQQRGQHHTQERKNKERLSTLSNRAILPPAIIPGPSDSRWRALLELYPEYQPALSQEEAEPHLRRGTDALANRTERLRATGNGVDPVVAAYAYLSLRATLAANRAKAGRSVLRRAA